MQLPLHVVKEAETTLDIYTHLISSIHVALLGDFWYESTLFTVPIGYISSPKHNEFSKSLK